MKKIGKKGFTLVELIVVIAIIGVLSAILVPTLIGYTINANVTSANSTAASMRKNINNYLVSADTNGYGMKISAANVTEGEIIVTNSVWTLTITDPSLFITGGRKTWTGTGSGKAGDPIPSTASAETELAVKLASQFPEIDKAYIKFNITAGNCNALYYTYETNTAITMQTFGPNGWSADVYTWNNDRAGICAEGFVVGTAPVLELG